MGHGGKVSTVETFLEMRLLKESPSGSWREGEYCRDVFRNETTKREPKWVMEGRFFFIIENFKIIIKKLYNNELKII